ncbi:MAG: Gfo/Idh/MocA family protein [Candidatus Polarisedimenticolia bacterium]
MRRIRFAVVGEGYIAQAAVLPAFRNASKHAELTALVSGDRVKLSRTGKTYGVSRLYTYDQFDEMLSSGAVDAVYIALPNDLHREYTVRAAGAGLHVLCEKPMAVTEDDCVAMIEAAERAGVKLMIAYRLHFEPAHLAAVELARSGKLGDLKLFNSTFTMQVYPPNIRLEAERGGGTLYDIGIYCINAARYFLGAEPVEALAVTANTGDRRFREVDEATSAVLRFPDGRLASFLCSFGAADISSLTLAGTGGHLEMDPAYEYAQGISLHVTADGRRRRRDFGKHDQFAAELIYFANCILRDQEPEPSGKEGLIDVRIILALYESARIGQSVTMEVPSKVRRPSRRQEMALPGIRRPRLVHTRGPSER